MFKSLVLALSLILIPVFALGQEPNHRKHRHTKVEVKLGEGIAPYVANAVDFDGTSDFLERGAGLTGAVDGKKGIVSFWFRLDGGDGIRKHIMQDAQVFFRIRRLDTDKFRVRMKLSASTKMQVTSTTSFTTSSSWVHVAASWDLSVPVAHLFINGVDDEDGTSIEVDSNVDYTDTDYGIGASVGGANKWNGCMSEIYVNLAEFLDISISTNLQKLRSIVGKPVSLGTDGSLPTGTAPIVYLNGDSTNFQTNQGTGGNFTVTGALSACSTSPTD